MKTALILVDIQNDYFPGGGMELNGSTAAGLCAGEVLAAFRDGGLPVVHVRHLSARPGATFFLPGTQGAQLHPGVSPLPGETVVEKNFPNSFRSTDLARHLRENFVEHLVVAGMMTHMCVDATVRAAFDDGFRCTVVHDACATRDLAFDGRTVAAADVHAAFLAALSGIYAEVLESREIISRVRGT